MIVPAPVDAKFRQVQPHLREVADRARSIISSYVERTGYAFVHRVKQTDSLSEKLETGRYQRWGDLDDLFACAIVVPTLAEEKDAVSFLESAFQKMAVRGRSSAQKDPSTFRFDTTRFIATLQPATEPEPLDALSRLKFEVQVRTAYEHAWAVATHRLVYKGAHVEWRRFRLLAHLKAASEQLDHLIIGFDTVSELIGDEYWPAVAVKAAIESRCRSWFESGDIPTDVEPSSWVRFSDNFYALLKASGAKPHVDGKLTATFEALDGYVRANRGERFPRSLSLLQTMLGVLARERFITSPLQGYYPLVTDQLRNLFPEVREIGDAFDFEMIGA
jgi:ppGpp synthetase/RelA/SpoT-type nucleotidyltranferase